MSTKERKRKSAKERKRKSAKECERSQKSIKIANNQVWELPILVFFGDLSALVAHWAVINFVTISWGGGEVGVRSDGCLLPSLNVHMETGHGPPSGRPSAEPRPKAGQPAMAGHGGPPDYNPDCQK